jgi:menaquinone-9 beta-reductase
MATIRDVLVVGGGPAGLATAIALASRGLDVLVLERRSGQIDKACGEGLLPPAAAALEVLGVRSLLAPDDVASLRFLRWIGDDGACAEARLPWPGGLGVRRTVLRAALAHRAREVGAEIRDGVSVLGHRRQSGSIEALTEDGPIPARLLVAADGLASPVRRREGLELPVTGPARFGMRRHVALAMPADGVEVHFGDGVEAYLTPIGAGRMGVAFLFEKATGASFPDLLARFPAIVQRVAGRPFETPPAGAGALERLVRARAADRLVLVGDAAGYVDAITGEGLALAFEGALALGRILPEAIRQGAGRDSLLPYERAQAASWRRYATVCRLVLGLSRHPRLRRRIIGWLSRHPALFTSLASWAVRGGAGPPGVIGNWESPTWPPRLPSTAMRDTRREERLDPPWDDTN